MIVKWWVQLRNHNLAPLLCLRLAGRRGRRGPRGPVGPTCEHRVKSVAGVCPVTRLVNGVTKACDDYACDCKAKAVCPAGQLVSSCLCSNTNPATPVDLGLPELDMRYPWVLTSNFFAMDSSSAGECSCTWVNTIPLVRICAKSKCCVFTSSIIIRTS